MAKYEQSHYDYGDGHYGRTIKANETVFLSYICMGGSSCNVTELRQGCSWNEGADELIGVYDSEKEAYEGIKEFFDTLSSGASDT